MGGGHHETAEILRHGGAEGDEGGAVAGHEIPLASLQSPVGVLVKLGVARLLQKQGGVIHRVVGGGASGDIIKQSLVHGKTSVI